MIIHQELLERGFMIDQGTRFINFYTLKYCQLDFELVDTRLLVMFGPNTEPFFEITSLNKLDKFLSSIQLRKTENVSDN